MASFPPLERQVAFRIYSESTTIIKAKLRDVDKDHPQFLVGWCDVGMSGGIPPSPYWARAGSSKTHLVSGMVRLT